MKVSVVLATYNGSKFIEEQMKSINSQTIKADEVYISDDCSTDNTVLIAKKFINENKLDGKWKINVNQKNKGYAKNFLDASIKSVGDVIFFCDQDDIWFENRIEIMVNILKKHEDINLLCSNVEFFYQDVNLIKKGKKELNDGTLEKLEFNTLNFHLRRPGCAMCIRKDFLIKIMPWWIERWAHDDFVWKMAIISNSCAVVNNCLLKRRKYPNSVTARAVKTYNREKRIHLLNDWKKQYEVLKRYVLEEYKTIKGIEIIDKNIRAIDIRKTIVEKRYVWRWFIICCKYRDCYPRIKGMYLDLYLALFNKYKNI